MVFGFGHKSLHTDASTFATPRGDRPPATLAEAGKDVKTFDFVIIGAGTAGSVLASRLSEDANVRVLVLEAGGDNRSILETRIPLTFGKLFHGVNDWDYYTTPQQHADNRELYWPRGRMVGGSSSMNAMMSHTCDRQDFDEWKTKFGCEGWGYDDLQPYMRRSEKFTPNPNRPAISTEHRGDSGLWQTGYSWLSEIGEKGFLGGCQEVGIPYNPDVNTPEGTLGCTRFQTFIDARGQRSSAATAYLPTSVLDRDNLDIAINTRVTRILFDTTSSSTPQAFGVELQTSQTGPVYQVFARKEVILCGGAVNTPQTLLLSGIGQPEQLEKFNIPVVKANAAVGTHLKDHFCTSGIVCKAKPGYTLDYLTSDIKAMPSLVRWLVTGGGPLTSNVGEAAAFIRSTALPEPISYSADSTLRDEGSGGIGPDIEIIGAPLRYVDHGADPAKPGEDQFSLVPIGLRPRSHGTVALQSGNVWDKPLIDPKYWTDEGDNDRKVLLAGLRVCLKIMTSEAMRSYLDPVPTNDDMTSYWWPYSSSNVDKITDEQLRSWMGRSAFTLYHPIGTARMGTSERDSVVDLQCRVHGVSGLRAMDASVFPEQISGHPTATIIAMAEKLSDSIRERHSLNAGTKATIPIDSRASVSAKL